MQPHGMFAYLFGSVSHILVVNVQGGTGGRLRRPPVYKKSAVTRRIHESEDGMSWITQRS